MVKKERQRNKTKILIEPGIVWINKVMGQKNHYISILSLTLLS